MKAEETVMKYIRIKEIIEDPKLDTEDDAAFAYNALEKVARIQARISFDAGLHYGVLRGRKEVIDWVESEDAIDRMMRERWQAKLKEWGLSTPTHKGGTE